MDDTNTSRTTDATAAATRKRRSSILKSQRPARTPLSELEFNVATPTDITKSRRVSFSKLTGVAEFVTNEATTTWKNVYEEHNKSMESSGNDSEIKPPRTIGRKVFDQQFEEVDAIDLILTMNNRNNPNINSSIQNLNFAPLEMTALSFDKLTAPQNDFELSTFTDNQSKVFSDHLTLTNMEVTQGMNINFSTVQPLSEKDDLDEIEKDLQRAQSNVICHGPSNGRNMSGYIEFDLNTTNVLMRMEEYDTSINDPVHNLKFPDVSRSISLDKKDWVVDKENIAINPYVALKESDNFAINQQSDEILVFDGKRLTTQFEKEIGNKNPRKTIPLNVKDDLSIFLDESDAVSNEKLGCVIPAKTIENGSTTIVNETKLRTVLYDDGMDISLTQALPTNIAISDMAKEGNHETTVFGKDIGNMSFTQAIPASITVFNNAANLSLTQVIPSNILTAVESKADKTIDQSDNLNMTQVSSNIEAGRLDNRKTILYESNGDISITQAIDGNILLPNSKEERRQTIVFENDGDMSMTQALPTNIPSQEQIDKRQGNAYVSKPNSSRMSEVVNGSTSSTKNNKGQTMIFDNDAGDISITQALPTKIFKTDTSVTNYCNIINKSYRRGPIMYDEDPQNISVIKALHSNVTLGDSCLEKQDRNYNDSMAKNLANDECQQENSSRQRTVNKKQDCDVLTPVVPCNNIMVQNDEFNKTLIQEKSGRRNTIHYEKEAADISITEALPTDILVNKASNLEVNIGKMYGSKETKYKLSEHIPDVSITSTKRKFINLASEISVTETLPNIVQIYKDNNQSERKLPLVNDKSDNSGIKTNGVKIFAKHDITVNKSFKKLPNLKDYTIDTSGNTISKPIPMELSAIHDEVIKRNGNKLDNTVMENMNQSVLVYQSTTTCASKSRLKSTEQGDVKSDRTLYRCDENTDSSMSVSDDIKPNVDVQATDVKKQRILENKISTTTFNKEAVSVQMVDINKPASILDDLLDMSTASMEGGLADKYCIAKVENTSIVSMKKPDVENDASNESMFYITQDSDVEAQIDLPRESLRRNVTPKIDTSPLPLENKKEQPSIVGDVRNKLAKLATVLKSGKKSPLHNRHYEKVVSSDAYENEKSKGRVASRSFKTADDTRELLQIISDFTDKKTSDYIEEDEELEPVFVKGDSMIENKSVVKPKFISFTANSQSIVVSREDLLNNISKVQATLRKSRHEFDEDDSIEETKESPEQSFHTNTVKMSSEVVKTLHFDDESASESSIKSELKMSPLKKTAFGETSYMRETKTNVIPSYLKDVSDNIKMLMSDLVKPIQEDMPFEVAKSDKGVRRSSSTCSTQVQANLITSSQIDIESDVKSGYQSPRQMDSANTLIGSIAYSGNRAVEHALKSALKSSRAVEMYSDIDVVSADDSFKELSLDQSSSGRCVSEKVLIFDHTNPLNNVLLAPPAYAEVHTYNPQKSSETVCFSERSDSVQISVPEKGYNVERISTQYLVETASIKQENDTYIEKPAHIQYSASNISKTMSIDEAIDVKPIDLKDKQVNTTIAMKGIKQLLEASSSLTLVDDALIHPEFDINVVKNISSQHDISYKKLQNPVKTIFTNELGDNSNKVESDLTSNDEKPEPMSVKTNKRVYSPANFDKHKNCTLPSLDLTPKPVSKIQKISESPISLKTEEVYSFVIDNDPDEKSVKDSTVKKSPSKPKREKNKSPKKSNNKPGTSVTVQQLLTEYDMDVDEHVTSENTIPSKVSKSDGEGRSVDMVCSFTSSKNLCQLSHHSVSNTVSYTTSAASGSSKNSRINCQSELDDLCSKNLIAESTMGVNVVAEIDMLPFMGSKDCEWDSWSGDTWTYRLLHSQLRLVVQLAHRHDNEIKTRVAADTPVLAVSVHTAVTDTLNPVLVVCVDFAAESMRYLASGMCSIAGDVPLLLRKCCALAGLALKWGRAMQDARAHLVCRLKEDKTLTLKVANIPLRSVWEVTMRLELMMKGEDEVLWPHATDVRIVPIMSDYKVTDEDLKQVVDHVPGDWGHVPRTIWRIFKYLQHKTA